MLILVFESYHFNWAGYAVSLVDAVAGFGQSAERQLDSQLEQPRQKSTSLFIRNLP